MKRHLLSFFLISMLVGRGKEWNYLFILKERGNYFKKDRNS